MRSDRPFIHLLLLTLVCAAAFFTHLDSFFPDIMESRNFISAREMVQDGNWLIPTLNGEPRIAKPPLPTWLTAASVLAFGDVHNVVALRLPAAVMGWLMVLFLYLLVRTVTRKPLAALFSGLVLATSVMLLQQARTGAWDIYTHSFMLGSLTFFARGWSKEHPAYLDFAVGGLLAGCAILSKGPVAPYAMLLPFLIAYVFSGGKNGMASKWKEALLALVVMLAVGLSWYAYAFTAMPQVVEAVAAQESGAWADRHKRKFYFYGHFALFIGAWLPLLIAGFVWPFAKRHIDGRSLRWLLIWAGLALVLLSVIPTKKERYLLPMFPPLAALVGLLIAGMWHNFQQKQFRMVDTVVFRVFAFVVGGALSVAPVALWVLHLQREFPVNPATIAGALCLSMCGVGMVFFGWKKLVPYAASALVIATCVFASLVLPHTARFYYNNPTWKDPRGIRELAEIDKLDFYGMNEWHMGIIWASGKKIRPFDPENLPPAEAFPLVLFTNQPPEKQITGKLSQQVRFRQIDDFSYYPRNADWRVYVNVLTLK